MVQRATGVIIAWLMMGVIGLSACASLQDVFNSSASPRITRGGKGGKTYIVKKGDTLSGIARKYDISYQYLAEYNNIDDPARLSVGQVVSIPKRGEKYAEPRKTMGGQEDIVHVDRDKFVWPVEGRLEGLFGPRRNTHHDGIDIMATKGTPVVAADSGEVVFSGVLSGYGNLIIVKHPDAYFTTYAHNQKNLVRKGDRVKRGKTKLAKVGKTGNASAPHLHFEVRYRELPRNPLFYLPKRQ